MKGSKCLFVRADSVSIAVNLRTQCWKLVFLVEENVIAVDTFFLELVKLYPIRVENEINS